MEVPLHSLQSRWSNTLPETNSSPMKIPHFSWVSYHPKWWKFSMASELLVYREGSLLSKSRFSLMEPILVDPDELWFSDDRFIILPQLVEPKSWLIVIWVLNVPKNRGGVKFLPLQISSILIGFFPVIFTINFGGFPPIFGNTHVYIYIYIPWAPLNLHVERFLKW